MREMKNSGVAWIGEIPADWNIVRGKVILENLSRKIESDMDVITCFRDGEVTLRKNRREEGFTFSDKEIGYQGIYPNDLVIHGMDGFAGAIGISDSKGKGSPILIVCDSKEDKEFLMYYLRNLAYRNIFLALSTGIRVRSCDLRWNKLSVLPFVLPSKKEQKLIVSELKKKSEKIDELIANQEIQIEKLMQYKQSLITEVVTKGLNPDVEMKDSGVEWIGEIPKHWHLEKIKFNTYINNDKQTGKTLPYIALEHILGYSSELIKTDSVYEITDAIVAEKEDVLFGKLRPYLAKVYIVQEKSYVSGEFAVFRANNIFHEYLRWYMLSYGFLDTVNASTYGTKMPRANIDFIKNLYIPIFDFVEQKKISFYLDVQCSKIDKLIEIKQSKIAKLNEYKKSLIYEYVTGKKEVV